MQHCCFPPLITTPLYYVPVQLNSRMVPKYVAVRQTTILVVLDLEKVKGKIKW